MIFKLRLRLILTTCICLPTLCIFIFSAAGELFTHERETDPFSSNYSRSIFPRESNLQIKSKGGKKQPEAPFKSYQKQIIQHGAARRQRRLQVEVEDQTAPTPPAFIQAKAQNTGFYF